MKWCEWFTKCRIQTCCGLQLDDGIHGIAIWDAFYSLFIITMTVSNFFNEGTFILTGYYVAALFEIGFLLLRVVFGICACTKRFQKRYVTIYFGVRIAWDIAMVIYFTIMAVQHKITVDDLFTQLLWLFGMDGYFNFAIYSFLKLQNQPILETISSEGEAEDPEEIAIPAGENQEEESK